MAVPMCFCSNMYEDWMQRYDAILQKYVKKGVVNGVHTNVVDYKGMRYDSKFTALGNLVSFDANRSSRAYFAALGEKGQLAFFINYYNYGAMKLIVENPGLKSITDLDKPGQPYFKQAKIGFQKRPFSLEVLKQSNILGLYKEPLSVFALCDTTVGGVPIREEAYTGKLLDQQLEDQLLRYVRSSAGVVFDKREDKVSLSRIFEEHQKLFSGGDVVAFLCRKEMLPLKAMKCKVDTIQYDWSLNCIPGAN